MQYFHTLGLVILVALVWSLQPAVAPAKEKGASHGPPDWNETGGQGKGKGKGKSSAGPENQDRDHGKRQYGEDSPAVRGGVYFSGDDRRVITDYFRGYPVPYQPLPPGIAKNLARGKPLPPGIAKRYPPHDLLLRLPRRDGYEYILAGSDILMVAIATGIIVDIIRDVLH